MKKLFTILAVLFFSANLYSTPADSCWDLIYKNCYECNPDSVMKDTCINSANYGKKFAKKFFGMNFQWNYYPFNKQIGKNEFLTIDDLKEDKFELKNQLLNLEDKFGKIYFSVINNDTQILYNPIFEFSFDQYQNVEEIVKEFKLGLDSNFVRRIVYHNRVAGLTSLE